MRRHLRPLLGLILAVAGSTTAVLVQALVRLATESFSRGNFVAWVGLSIGLVACTAEWTWNTSGRPRPWSVNRQVPQSWGHRQGPWLAAARYGFRLGFGPGTILNSWTWWAGFGLASIIPNTTNSAAAWLLFPLWFAVARAVLIVWLPGNPPDGVWLSKRMARIAELEVHSRTLTNVVSLLSVIGLAATALWLS